MTRSDRIPISHRDRSPVRELRDRNPGVERVRESVGQRIREKEDRIILDSNVSPRLPFTRLWWNVETSQNISFTKVSCNFDRPSFRRLSNGGGPYPDQLEITTLKSII